jgi:parafibromin
MSLPPEHLPSSPLCPKNPMHKSKGRGICVYHGRRRSVSLRRTDGDSSGYSSHFYDPCER